MLLHKNKKRNGTNYLLIGWLLLLSLDTLANTVAVVYPDIREPYLSVFRDIANGISTSVNGRVKQYKLKKTTDIADLQGWLEKKQANIVIALGKQGIAKAKQLPADFTVIVGGILSPAGAKGLQGISLSPAPEYLFAQLKQLSPSVVRVTVVYSEKNSGWLIPFAQAAAQQQRIQLNAIAVQNLFDAATLYRDLLQGEFGATQAIWLLQDSVTVDQRTILPMLLKQAWAKQFVVFSSNPSYVKRGVLFALYPDNHAMGQSLGRLAEQRLKGLSVQNLQVVPLIDLMVAVNLRAAEHLGLGIDLQQHDFDLVFPPPQ